MYTIEYIRIISYLINKYMIYKEVSFNTFCDSFGDSYKNNFTYEGKKALYEYLEDYSESTGENIELDTIALCCEYSQYDDIGEYNANYNYSGESVDSIEEIEEKTQVIRIENSESFIILAY